MIIERFFTLKKIHGAIFVNIFVENKYVMQQVLWTFKEK